MPKRTYKMKCLPKLSLLSIYFVLTVERQTLYNSRNNNIKQILFPLGISIRTC